MLERAQSMRNEIQFTLKQQLEAAHALPVHNPEDTFLKLNKEYKVNASMQEAVKQAWPYEQGDTMFNVIQTYTHAAQMPNLPPEDSFELQLVGGKILSSVRVAA